MIDFTLGICCLSRDFPADWVASEACAVVFQLCRPARALEGSWALGTRMDGDLDSITSRRERGFFAILTFYAKREYIPSNASVK